MSYLAIDTSGKNLTVIIENEGKTYTFFDETCGANHSIELMPRVEELAKEAKFEIKDADFFACVVGAGSFTGIRIGVATVKALCFAYNKPCLSITSFDTLAYNKKGGKVMAVIDAKHNGFYVCGYEDNSVVIPPCYVMREKLLELKEGYELLSFESIKDLEITVVSVAEGFKNAINDKCGRFLISAKELEPLYVRKSQAEEGR